MIPLLGCDLSDNQGKWNAQKAYDEGVRLAILRITAGTDYIDPKAEIYMNSCKSVGIAYGFYHFYRQWQDGLKQANWFVTRILQLGGHGNTRPYVDFELYNYVYPDKMLACLRSVFLQLEVTPGIYTGYSWWTTYMYNRGQRWGNEYPLWVANYVDTAPKVPKPWTPNRQECWQYTSTAWGPKYGTESLELDLDVWHGDTI